MRSILTYGGFTLAITADRDAKGFVLAIDDHRAALSPADLVELIAALQEELSDSGLLPWYSPAAQVAHDMLKKYGPGRGSPPG